VALLAEWQWWLAKDEKTLWIDTLKAKYRGKCEYASNLFSRYKFKFCSLWWKEIRVIRKRQKMIKISFEVCKEKYW